MSKGVKLLNLYIHDLEVLVPNDQHRIRLRPESNMRITTLLYSAAVLLFVEDHSHLKDRLDLAESNKGLSTYSHQGASIAMTVSHLVEIEV